MAQSKMKKEDKVKVTVDDAIPLERCFKMSLWSPTYWCALTWQVGKYFYYYKCKHPKHNNISAIKAHEQFLNACDLMSISQTNIKEIRNGCHSSIELEMKANNKKVVEKKKGTG